MSKRKKTSNLYAAFRADILWLLEPLVNYARMQEDDRFLNGNVFVEPAAQGGAYIGAVCQHAMMVIHDADAVCHEAMTLDIPYQVFAAAELPDPVVMNYCGETLLLDVPEWMQPGLCYAHSAGIFIHPKMRPPIWSNEDDEFWPCLQSITASTSHHHIGRDYRATSGAPVDWRKPLKSTATRATVDGQPSFTASPELMGLFDRTYTAAVDDAIQRETGTPYMHFRLAGNEEPIIVSIENRPDFIGALMPTKSKSQPATPWHFLKSPRPAEAG